jgi:CubicO group peptidase (beta-lactamase class C family)
VHQAEIPGANGIGNARSLACIYSATVSTVDGIRLLGDEARDRARTSNTPQGELDSVLIDETDFGMGFMVYSPYTEYSGPSSFGHNGAGGSVAFAEVRRELAFAYVMNTMMTVADGDPRRNRLTAAASLCADSV